VRQHSQIPPTPAGVSKIFPGWFVFFFFLGFAFDHGKKRVRGGRVGWGGGGGGGDQFLFSPSNNKHAKKVNRKRGFFPAKGKGLTRGVGDPRVVLAGPPPGPPHFCRPPSHKKGQPIPPLLTRGGALWSGHPKGGVGPQGGPQKNGFRGGKGGAKVFPPGGGGRTQDVPHQKKTVFF